MLVQPIGRVTFRISQGGNDYYTPWYSILVDGQVLAIPEPWPGDQQLDAFMHVAPGNVVEFTYYQDRLRQNQQVGAIAVDGNNVG